MLGSSAAREAVHLITVHVLEALEGPVGSLQVQVGCIERSMALSRNITHVACIMILCLQMPAASHLNLQAGFDGRNRVGNDVLGHYQSNRQRTVHQASVSVQIYSNSASEAICRSQLVVKA